jgi:hypothetical protein
MPAKRFLWAFFVSYAVAHATFSAWSIYLDTTHQLPVFRVSNSVSLDEKAWWLRENGIGSCDVLASGSSMTLNNLSSDRVAARFPDRSFRNVSSWGVRISENLKLLKEISRHCTPKILIIVSGPTDFRSESQSEADFEPDRLEHVLNGGLMLSRYLNLGLMRYYAEQHEHLAKMRSRRDAYQSLDFDQNGGVPLADQDWSVFDKRWDRRVSINAEDAQYDALIEIASFSSASGVRFVLVQSPVRTKVVKKYEDDIRIQQHLARLEHLARAHGFEFYDYLTLFDGQDNRFADSTHLRQTGASIFTERLLNDLQYAQDVQQADAATTFPIDR